MNMQKLQNPQLSNNIVTNNNQTTEKIIEASKGICLNDALENIFKKPTSIERKPDQIIIGNQTLSPAPVNQREVSFDQITYGTTEKDTGFQKDITTGKVIFNKIDNDTFRITVDNSVSTFGTTLKNPSKTFEITVDKDGKIKNETVKDPEGKIINTRAVSQEAVNAIIKAADREVDSEKQRLEEQKNKPL